MCGIFGMVGNVPDKHQLEIYHLMCNTFRASKQRGKDASGFSALHRDEGAQLITDKRPICSHEFVKRSKLFKALKRSLPSILIGHTRATTSGNPKRNRNNHPFNSSQLSLTHNGTLKEWRNTVKSEGINMRTETDSELILRIIEQDGSIKDGIQSVINKVHKDSAMALGILNHTDEPTLTLFTNGGRPLYIFISKKLRTVFYCSTKQIFETALKMTFKNDTAKWTAAMELQSHEVKPFQYIQFGLNPFNNPYKREVALLDKPIVKVGSTQKNKAAKTCAGKEAKPAETPKLPMRTKEPIVTPSYEQANSVEIEIRRVTAVVESIYKSPFITHRELQHYKTWRSKL